MPKRKSNEDRYGEIKKLNKQFRQMQEHLSKLCESSESSESSSEGEMPEGEFTIQKNIEP
ncbi:unnamed protein product, partial [Callosobruchus maculatus]